ncbi:MAG: methyltransferase domain-containing protein [Myxococcales bacterium]|nr:methyltransferase domain-containing protein [Myxococcales bacterium]
MTTANAAFWDELAERYAAKPVELPDAFERKIAITQARMTPQSVVLDIGCGTGSLALRLADHGAQIHGLDVSGEMIRIARQKTAAASVDNVQFHLGPCDERLAAFDTGSLDGICAYSILHLLGDRQAALQEIYRLLKPGGFFISSTVCLGESKIPMLPLITVMRWLGKAPMVKSVTKAALVAEMAEAGFVDFQQPEVGAKATTAFIVATKPL